jgi:uncharacterized protein (UPF0548 family)
MADWRFGRGWSEAEMRRYLARLRERTVNFDVPVEQMTAEHGWTVDGSHDLIGCEGPGPPVPDGVFERARKGILNYDFSDPRIVEGHFDPETELIGRDILLEIKVLGLRFLSGARVHSTREETREKETIFGFRYDTLEGHIERGYEWFMLSKDHQTGEVWFKIEAHWRLGDFPNWWSRLGFHLVGDPCRRKWRHRAPRRLQALICKDPPQAVGAPGRLAHRGDVRPTPTEPVREP